MDRETKKELIIYAFCQIRDCLATYGICDLVYQLIKHFSNN